MQTYNQLRIDSSNKKFFPCSWSNKSSPIGMNFEIENTFSLFFFRKHSRYTRKMVKMHTSEPDEFTRVIERNSANLFPRFCTCHEENTLLMASISTVQPSKVSPRHEFRKFHRCFRMQMH